MVEELGLVPLKQFARAWGVPVTAARLERERRSIQPQVEPIVLPEEVIRQLGHVRDTELARRYAISRKQLTGYRNTHSIPSFRDQNWHLDWTAERLKLLGTVSDIVLANRWKVSEAYLRAERRRRGIPSFKAPAHWTSTMRAFLGKEPDAKVAERFGLTFHQVAGERKRLGIRGHGSPKPSFCWLPQHDRLLGTAVDVEIAKRLGLSKMQVASRRWRLGVMAWRMAQIEPSSKSPRHKPAK